jgi:hypothetical protein
VPTHLDHLRGGGSHRYDRIPAVKPVFSLIHTFMEEISDE